MSYLSLILKHSFLFLLYSILIKILKKYVQQDNSQNLINITDSLNFKLSQNHLNDTYIEYNDGTRIKINSIIEANNGFIYLIDDLLKNTQQTLARLTNDLNTDNNSLFYESNINSSVFYSLNIFNFFYSFLFYIILVY